MTEQRVLNQTSDRSMVIFWCPGCESPHGVWLRGHEHLNPHRASWDWNGDLVKPTFSPSILVHASERQPRCHSFVRDGMIEYLTDSSHKLAGQTVPLPPRD